MRLNRNTPITLQDIDDDAEKFISKPAGRLILTGHETPAELLKLAEVSQDEEIEQDKVCIEIEQNGVSYTIGTLGGIVSIIGKAKSRKTFFASVFLAMWINLNSLFNLFKATPPENQPICLFFDTEQSRYHVQKVLNRVLRLAKKLSCPNFKTYYLRRYTYQQRLDVIEEAIYNTPGVGLVVIDGVRDLVSDINNPAESTEVVGKLMKWSDEKNICIVTILHQNKGDNNARGHLGTELVNKSESVISVSKEGEISIVAPEFCRDKDFEPFAFGIDLDGLPIPVSYEPARKEKTTSVNPNSIPDESFREAIKKAFVSSQKLLFKELQCNLRLAFGNMHINMGESKIKLFIQDAINKKYIVTEGTPKTKNFFYSQNIFG